MTNVELRQERGEVLREAKALSGKGKLTVSEQRTFNSLMHQAEELKEQIEAVEARDLRRVMGGGAIQPGGSERTDPKVEEHRTAFKSYLRSGLAAMPPEERSALQEFRDMGTGGQGAYPGATTGFFVPVGFTSSIVDALKTTGPLLDPGVVEIMDSATGQQLPFPTENDTSVSGERVAENSPVGSADVTLGQILLGAYKYSTKLVKVSTELMQDSFFDIETFLIDIFSRRLGRILNSDFTVGLGSGSSQPLGVITSTLASGTLVTAAGSLTNDGVGGVNTIGSDDLIALEHAVDPLYRPRASYMMNDATLRRFKTVKDKYGRPLWQPSLVAGAPSTFNGYPLRVNNSMDALQATVGSPPVTKNTVLFGDLKRYLVRRVRTMSVLRLEERYAEYGQVGFLGFARYDASPMYAGTGNAFPFALLQNGPY